MPKTPGSYFGFTRRWILTMMSVMYDMSIELDIEFEDLTNDTDLIKKIIVESNRIINSEDIHTPMNNITPDDIIQLLTHQL